jgi:hypothetical protein
MRLKSSEAPNQKFIRMDEVYYPKTRLIGCRKKPVVHQIIWYSNWKQTILKISI